MKTTDNRLTVPLMNSLYTTQEERNSVLAWLNRAKTQRVFLAVEWDLLFSEDRRDALRLLRENLHFFSDAGMECGVWLQAFGFGDPLPARGLEISRDFTKIRSLSGKQNPNAFCPTSKAFMERYLHWIADIAGTGTKLILLDDDLCLSVRPGIGCFCRTHMRLLGKRLGRTVCREEFQKKMLVGGSNELRDAWLDVTADTLRTFCRQVRHTVDSFDPTIRVGFCAGYTSFDMEGADALELTMILAGENEPLLRLTGAPYWCARDVMRFGPMALGEVVESVRMQEKYCRGHIRDVFHEGDGFPRPRYHVPATLMECYDLALRASGGMGAMQYMACYYNKAEYETGYFRMHCKNQPLAELLEREFATRRSDGVYVYSRMRRIREDVLTSPMLSEQAVMERFFSPAQSMLARQGIPMTYEDEHICAGIAFGAADVKKISDLPEKLILDLPAAQALSARGTDTGLVSAIAVKPLPGKEHFRSETVRNSSTKGDFYICSISPHAVPESWDDDGNVMSYCYQSGNCEMLVLTADAYTIAHNHDYFCSYCRRSQLLAFVGQCFPYLSDGNYPAYTICKRGDDLTTAALFLNLSEDVLIDPVITLDKDYASVMIDGMSFHRAGAKITLCESIAPYSAVTLLAEEKL